MVDYGEDGIIIDECADGCGWGQSHGGERMVDTSSYGLIRQQASWDEHKKEHRISYRGFVAEIVHVFKALSTPASGRDKKVDIGRNVIDASIRR